VHQRGQEHDGNDSRSQASPLSIERNDPVMRASSRLLRLRCMKTEAPERDYDEALLLVFERVLQRTRHAWIEHERPSFIEAAARPLRQRAREPATE
jgi:hypothetical protein